MKNKYRLKIVIDTEIETTNPYPEKDMAAFTLYTLIQRNIEGLEREIMNISEARNASELSDYILELKEQKKIIQNIINDNFKIDVELLNKAEKENNLKLIVNNKK